jgi:hypothetical protein
MWAISRRTGLFVVSYAPLAAMFMLSRWPEGRAADEMVSALAFVAAIVVLLVLPFAAPVLVGARVRVAAVLSVAGAVAVLVIGLLRNWAQPLVNDPRGSVDAATISGVAWGFLVLAGLVLALVIYNAHRVGAVDWTVKDPRDQGGAVAGYLATYLLPLLSPVGSGWRVVAAYSIYLLIVYIIFIRSEGLVLVNPTLYLIGYRVFDVEVIDPGTDEKKRILLVTNQRIVGELQQSVVPLGDDCFLSRRSKE